MQLQANSKVSSKGHKLLRKSLAEVKKEMWLELRACITKHLFLSVYLFVFWGKLPNGNILPFFLTTSHCHANQSLNNSQSSAAKSWNI